MIEPDGIRQRLRGGLLGTVYHDDRDKIARILMPFVQNMINEARAEAQRPVTRLSRLTDHMSWCRSRLAAEAILAGQNTTPEHCDCGVVA